MRTIQHIRNRLFRFRAVLNAATWLIREFVNLKADVKELIPEIRSLQPIKLADWQRHVKYFRCETNSGKRYFLKTDGLLGLLENEIKVLQFLSETTSVNSLFPKLVCSRISGPFRYTLLEYVEGVTLLELVKTYPISELAKQVLAGEIVRILTELHRLNLIHRDLTPSNLMVVDYSGTAPRLVLVDFAFALIGQEWHELDLHSDVLSVICSGYKPSEWEWDDAFSCMRIIDLLDAGTGTLHREKERIKSMVGALKYSFSRNRGLSAKIDDSGSRFAASSVAHFSQGR